MIEFLGYAFIWITATVIGSYLLAFLISAVTPKSWELGGLIPIVYGLILWYSISIVTGLFMAGWYFG